MCMKKITGKFFGILLGLVLALGLSLTTKAADITGTTFVRSLAVGDIIKSGAIISAYNTNGDYV